MTRLLTHHDPFHLHATLGALTLLNYLYRWTLLLTTGTAFPDTEDVRFQTASVLIHTLLPLSSLLLRLPKKRNFSKPMIWPEFRLHSLIFASRHVVATILALYSLTNIYVDAAIVLVAAKLAKHVTDTIGDPVQRTTNSMPYPKSFPESYIQNTKLYYAICQFLASALIYGDDPSMCYMPLLAIQISPLMMTLVRKNKASSAAYHVLYSWALFLPALGMLSRVHNFPAMAPTMIYVLILGDLTRSLRLRLELNKYLIWIVGPIFAMYIQEKLSYYYGNPATFAYICLGMILPIFAYIRTGHTLLWYQLYKPAVVPVKGVTELLHSMPEYVGEHARNTWEKSKEAHKTLIQ